MELAMSAAVLKEELADIQEIYLEMGPGKAQHMLTSRSTIQQQLYDLFELHTYAPAGKAATLSLHTADA